MVVDIVGTSSPKAFSLYEIEIFYFQVKAVSIIIHKSKYGDRIMELTEVRN